MVKVTSKNHHNKKAGKNACGVSFQLNFLRCLWLMWEGGLMKFFGKGTTTR
jgi:hypothetical protein